MEGNCVFEYCYFSGNPNVNGNATFIRCNVDGTVTDSESIGGNWFTPWQIVLTCVIIILIAIFSSKMGHTIKEKAIKFLGKGMQLKTH